MANDSGFIAEMESKIRYHRKEYHRHNTTLMHEHGPTLKRLKTSSYLYRGLIEYYGETEGKRQWASYIRKRKKMLQGIRAKSLVHLAEWQRLKSVLALYKK